MAYKYFSLQLLNSDIDLSQVFPEKQDIARDNNNVTYNLGDIVFYLKDATQDFKFQDNKYVDLDNGIREIINKYYKSLGTKNPFETNIDEDVFAAFEEGVNPRDAAIVEEGSVKSKNVKAAPAATPAPLSTKTVVPLDEKIAKFKNELDNRQFLLDDADPEERAELLELFQKRLEGAELLVEDNGEATDELALFDKARYELLKDFVNKNS